MELKKVESSTVKAIGYNDEDNSLVVEFLNNSKYKYLKVPKNIYEDFLNAGSKGVYMNCQIRNRYFFEKLGD